MGVARVFSAYLSTFPQWTKLVKVLTAMAPLMSESWSFSPSVHPGQGRPVLGTSGFTSGPRLRRALCLSAPLLSQMSSHSALGFSAAKSHESGRPHVTALSWMERVSLRIGRPLSPPSRLQE